MNQHRTGRSAHEKGFHPFPRPFRCAPPFLRSLETNTADSEIVRETKYTCPRKLILSNLPFSSSLQDFFPSISSSQPFVHLTRLLLAIINLIKRVQDPNTRLFFVRITTPWILPCSLKRRNNNLIGLLACLPVSKLTSIRN